MKVLALASYPKEAACTRYRVEQFVEPLAERGITVTVRPFIDSDLFARLYQQRSWLRTALGLTKSGLLRLRDVVAAANADVVLVQREAMLIGPPIIEWLTKRVLRRPMVLDLDDATYVSYTSPTYGSVGRILKWSGKTDDLIRWANAVICGNRFIADYVSNKGARARIIPTIVDTNIFRPAEDQRDNAEPVLGWIGTHSTFPYLEAIFPVLIDLAQRHKFRLRIVGAGRDDIELSGVTVENIPWTLDREVKHFRSLDIGLYPIEESLYEGWASGKSGFKAIQYMAVGIPFVATPVGGSREIGEPGRTHLDATTRDEWYRALDELLSHPDRCRLMGAAGREYALQHYALEDQADKLAAVLREVASG
jgi:glycosyltransferase involved in cell wall biosynthesis